MKISYTGFIIFLYCLTADNTVVLFTLGELAYMQLTADNTVVLFTLGELAYMQLLVMGYSPERKLFNSVSNLIQFFGFPLLPCMTWHRGWAAVANAHVQVSTVQTCYKALINHESWCLNSQQEQMQEQWDSAKWGVRNWNGKCCCLPVIQYSFQSGSIHCPTASPE